MPVASKLHPRRLEATMRALISLAAVLVLVAAATPARAGAGNAGLQPPGGDPRFAKVRGLTGAAVGAFRVGTKSLKTGLVDMVRLSSDQQKLFRSPKVWGQPITIPGGVKTLSYGLLG